MLDTEFDTHTVGSAFLDCKWGLFELLYSIRLVEIDDDGIPVSRKESEFKDNNLIQHLSASIIFSSYFVGPGYKLTVLMSPGSPIDKVWAPAPIPNDAFQRFKASSSASVSTVHGKLPSNPRLDQAGQPYLAIIACGDITNPISHILRQFSSLRPCSCTTHCFSSKSSSWDARSLRDVRGTTSTAQG